MTTLFLLTQAVVAAASSLLVVGSYMMMALMAAVCCMHSWGVRRLVEQEQVGWDLRRPRVPGRRRLLLV
jgi:hypothetical protein